MEDNIKNLSSANQVSMVNDGNIIETGSYTQDPLTGQQTKSGEPSIQLLQRGYIVTAPNGGPVDVTEVVTGIDSESDLNKLTTLFQKIGNLYYGKKVYVVGLNRFYYYSRSANASSMSDDAWQPIGFEIQ